MIIDLRTFCLLIWMFNILMALIVAAIKCGKTSITASTFLLHKEVYNSSN